MTKLFVMPAKASPTAAELAILRVLWTIGPSTVRRINEVMSIDRRIGYSTTLKMVQIMTEKGLLARNDLVRPQIFKPAVAEAKTQVQLLDELIQRAFGGSASKLVMRAASAKRISSAELAEIKAIIDRENKK